MKQTGEVDFLAHFTMTITGLVILNKTDKIYYAAHIIAFLYFKFGVKYEQSPWVLLVEFILYFIIVRISGFTLNISSYTVKT